MGFQLQTLTEYSDEAILAEVRRVAAELGGHRLTIEQFDSRARVHSTMLRARFGSWSAALDRAGIDETIAPRPKKLSRDAVLDAIQRYAAAHPSTSPTRDIIAGQLGVDAGSISRRFGKWENLLSELGLNPVPLGRRYTDEECFENILTLWTYYGRQPHFAELNQPPSRVGSKAYVGRWRGWRRALAAFIARANETPTELDDKQFEPPGDSATESRPASITPRSISLSLRYRVLLRDRFRCVSCGRSPAKDGTVNLHVDHIVPWSRGGQNTESNLRTLCFECNVGKGARLDEP
jgi:hypothetical protein